MLADTPSDQSERLAALNAYKVLDTDPEQGFDDVVQLAARICETPVALISLVDKDRQWFKARFGFDGDQTPLDRSICSHAILQDDLLEIPDTTADDRTADNPLCLQTDAPLRFYAGAPLITDDGHRLGTLCVLDFRPRKLTDLQRETLRVLATQVMKQLDLRRALVNESVLRDEIDHRVKNSLQTVMSFIRLYSGGSKSDETREALAAIGRRVSAVAQLHAELYRTDEIDRISLDRYLNRVLDLLRSSGSAHVALRADIAPMHTDSRTAAILAMIVSEFTANAIKHAFPEGRKGEVLVRLEARDEDGFELVCRDNGVGDVKPAAQPVNDVASIGMRLMESAAEQIGGDLSITAGPDGYLLRLVKLPRPQVQTAIRAVSP